MNEMGEVRWYKFAHPDKSRPVLILTRDSVIEVPWRGDGRACHNDRSRYSE